MAGYRKGGKTQILNSLKDRSKKWQHRGLFVSDLDGTLLTNRREIAAVDLKALSKLREMGYLVAIATGRSNYSFNKLMDTLGYLGPTSTLPIDYIIFSTGAGIMDYPGTKLLQSLSLPPEDVRSIVNHLESSDLDFMVHRSVPDTRYFLYNYRGESNPDFLRRLKMYKGFATPLSTETFKEFGGATEVLCIVPGEKGHQTATHLQEIFKQFSVIKATSPLDGESIWVEIFSPDVSKSKAVKWLAGTVGIARKNTCAVGNDFNDEDLLHWAEKSYVVANSPPSLKSRFETVASNEGGGVGEAVGRWLGLQAAGSVPCESRSGY